VVVEGRLRIANDGYCRNYTVYGLIVTVLSQDAIGVKVVTMLILDNGARHYFAACQWCKLRIRLAVC